nr:MAG TPA: hypothetical protein [Caudoviricetes sp.]
MAYGKAPNKSKARGAVTLAGFFVSTSMTGEP